MCPSSLALWGHLCPRHCRKAISPCTRPAAEQWAPSPVLKWQEGHCNHLGLASGTEGPTGRDMDTGTRWLT